MIIVRTKPSKLLKMRQSRNSLGSGKKIRSLQAGEISPVEIAAWLAGEIRYGDGFRDGAGRRIRAAIGG